MPDGRDNASIIRRRRRQRRALGPCALLGVAVASGAACGDQEALYDEAQTATRSAYAARLQPEPGQPAELRLGERAGQTLPARWHLAGSQPICLVSHAAATEVAYATMALRNHAEYALEHGYHVLQTGGLLVPGEAALCRHAATPELQVGLGWQKLWALQEALARRAGDHGPPSAPEPPPPLCGWVLWVAPTCVLTDFARPLEQLTRAWGAVTPGGEQVDLLTSRRDLPAAGRWLDTDVMLLRNTQKSRGIIARAARHFAALGHLENGAELALEAEILGLSLDPNHPDPTEWDDIVATLPTGIGLAPERSLLAPWVPDPAEGGPGSWRVGDLVAQVPGPHPVHRAHHMARLLERLARPAQAAASENALD